MFGDEYDLNSQLTIMFQSQEQLVMAGARDFVYINVVPFDRAPQGTSSPNPKVTTGNTTPDLGSRISQWNSLLPQYANNFLSQHSNISVAVYDLHTLFETVLNNPTKYGFKDATSGCHTSECIWVDEGPHSTYGMHKVIAADMVRFLENPTSPTSPFPTPTTTSTTTPSKSATAQMVRFDLPYISIALVVGGLLVGVLSGR